MKAYETSTTVEDRGQVRVAGVPFAPGTQVDVTITPKRSSAEEFTAAWQRVCARLRGAPELQALSDDDIQKEINDYRAGQ